MQNKQSVILRLTPDELISLKGLPEDVNVWEHISQMELSEAFITEHAKDLDWEHVAIWSNLSEDLIEANADELDEKSWAMISKYQRLSEKFIADHKDDLAWCHIAGNQQLSKEFKADHKDRVEKWKSQYTPKPKVDLEGDEIKNETL